MILDPSHLSHERAYIANLVAHPKVKREHIRGRMTEGRWICTFPVCADVML